MVEVQVINKKHRISDKAPTPGFHPSVTFQDLSLWVGQEKSKELWLVKKMKEVEEKK